MIGVLPTDGFDNQIRYNNGSFDYNGGAIKCSLGHVRPLPLDLYESSPVQPEALFGECSCF